MNDVTRDTKSGQNVIEVGFSSYGNVISIDLVINSAETIDDRSVKTIKFSRRENKREDSSRQQKSSIISQIASW